MAATPLDDSQLLVLSILAYRLDRAPEMRCGCTLGEVAQDIEGVLLQRQMACGARAEDNASQLMSYRDWCTVTACTRETPALARLVVDACDVDERGAKMMMLSDGEGGAYAVFSGTGAGEWADNAQAAYSADSPCQLAALSWFERACEGRRYAQVTACGHSKGGNKALYLAVRAPKAVDRAVGFDAQGFSREFVRACGDAILENTVKITLYSLDNDYVNGLLSCIALHSRRIYVDGSHVGNPAAYHSPYALFVPQQGASGRTLVLGAQVPQGSFGRAFREFSDFVQDTAPADEYRQVCDCLGAALENVLAPVDSDADRASRAVEIGGSEGFRLLLGYLARFFEQTAQGVTPADVVAFLLPGKRGATVLDDVKLAGLDAVRKLLKRF